MKIKKLIILICLISIGANAQWTPKPTTFNNGIKTESLEFNSLRNNFGSTYSFGKVNLNVNADGAFLEERLNNRGNAVDQLNNIYIGNTSTFKIYKITPEGDVSVIAENVSPEYIEVDPLGNVIFFDSETGLLQKVTTGGDISTLATSEVYYLEAFPAIDKDGTIYAIDYNEYSLVKISPNGDITEINKDGYLYADPIKIDEEGSIYAIDANTNNVLKIDKNNNQTVFFENSTNIKFIEFDNLGNTYFASTNNTVYKKTNSGEVFSFQDIRFTSGFTITKDNVVIGRDKYYENITSISPDGEVTIITSDFEDVDKFQTAPLLINIDNEEVILSHSLDYGLSYLKSTQNNGFLTLDSNGRTIMSNDLVAVNNTLELPNSSYDNIDGSNEKAVITKEWFESKKNKWINTRFKLDEITYKDGYTAHPVTFVNDVRLQGLDVNPIVDYDIELVPMTNGTTVKNKDILKNQFGDIYTRSHDNKLYKFSPTGVKTEISYQPIDDIIMKNDIIYTSVIGPSQKILKVNPDNSLSQIGPALTGYYKKITVDGNNNYIYAIYKPSYSQGGSRYIIVIDDNGNEVKRIEYLPLSEDNKPKKGVLDNPIELIYSDRVNKLFILDGDEEVFTLSNDGASYADFENNLSVIPGGGFSEKIEGVSYYYSNFDILDDGVDIRMLQGYKYWPHDENDYGKEVIIESMSMNGDIKKTAFKGLNAFLSFMDPIQGTSKVLVHGNFNRKNGSTAIIDLIEESVVYITDFTLEKGYQYVGVTSDPFEIYIYNNSDAKYYKVSNINVAETGLATIGSDNKISYNKSFIIKDNKLLRSNLATIQDVDLAHERTLTTKEWVKKEIETPKSLTMEELKLTNIPVYADDAAALAGGLETGAIYRTATGELRIKL